MRQDSEELDVSQVLIDCAVCVPCGLEPDVAIGAHQEAYRRRLENDNEGSRGVAEHALRTLWFARTATDQDVGALMEYAADLPIEAWFEQKGFTREDVRAELLSLYTRWMRDLAN